MPDISKIIENITNKTGFPKTCEENLKKSTKYNTKESNEFWNRIEAGLTYTREFVIEASLHNAEIERQNGLIRLPPVIKPEHQVDNIIFELLNMASKNDWEKIDNKWVKRAVCLADIPTLRKHGEDVNEIEAKTLFYFLGWARAFYGEDDRQTIIPSERTRKVLTKLKSKNTLDGVVQLSKVTPHDSSATDHQRLFTPDSYAYEKVIDMTQAMVWWQCVHAIALALGINSIAYNDFKAKGFDTKKCIGGLNEKKRGRIIKNWPKPALKKGRPAYFLAVMEYLNSWADWAKVKPWQKISPDSVGFTEAMKTYALRCITIKPEVFRASPEYEPIVM